LAKDVDGIDSMFTLIQGMFNKNRLRDIIRNFIYIPDSSKKNEKIVCRYPQYYAARALYDNIKKPKSPKETEKAELTLAPQVAVRVSPCFISHDC
jgi:type I restriction enzyme R subunit